MQKLTRVERKQIQDSVREEWFSLYLMDSNKKTPVVRRRMRFLYTKFIGVR